MQAVSNMVHDFCLAWENRQNSGVCHQKTQDLWEERASNRKTSLQCKCIWNKEKSFQWNLHGVSFEKNVKRFSKYVARTGNSGCYVEDIPWHSCCSVCICVFFFFNGCGVCWLSEKIKSNFTEGKRREGGRFSTYADFSEVFSSWRLINNSSLK